MDSFINPTIYEKKNINLNGSTYTGLYYKDDKGRDWYKTLADWVGAISVDAQFRVCAFESDVSYMGIEEGRDVYEIDPKGVPDNVIGNFSYQEGAFKDIRPNDVDIAKSKKSELLQMAGIAITPLQDAVDIDDATEAELQALKAWKTYRVALNRLDLTIGSDITWPEIPG